MINWTPEQEEIFNWFATGDGNLVVRARAGCAKTTTAVEAVKRNKKGKAIFLAFNKEIANEAERKIGKACKVRTLHAVGLWGVNSGIASRVSVDGARGKTLAAVACGFDPRDLKWWENGVIANVAKLAAWGKNTLTEDVAGLLRCTHRAGIQLGEEALMRDWTEAKVAEAAEKAMHLSLDVEKDQTVDFDDMLYVACRRRFVPSRWSLVIVDEAQDMNACQLAYARMLCARGGRICVIGDDMQAIYGFRGADVEAIDRMKLALCATEHGLKRTFRCASSIVALAQTYVPDFEGTREFSGVVRSEGVDQTLVDVREGDFILSRTNAPLLGLALELIRNGKRAFVRGREIGKGLALRLTAAERKVGGNLDEILKHINDGIVAQIAKMTEDDAETAAQLRDTFECLKTLSEGCTSVRDVLNRIADLFDDNGRGRIMLSTIHKAKGLEAKRVYLLAETMQRAGSEEDRLRYVAITRAMDELVWTSIASNASGTTQDASEAV